MKEDLQSKLVEIIGSIQAATGRAADFTIAQLPDIAQSYVLYGRVSTAALSLFLLLVAAGCLYVAWYSIKNPWNTSEFLMDKHKKRSESNYFAIWASGSVGMLLLTIAVASFDWLVWIAPKVWLIKEIARIIK